VEWSEGVSACFSECAKNIPLSSLFVSKRWDRADVGSSRTSSSRTSRGSKEEGGHEKEEEEEDGGDAGGRKSRGKRALPPSSSHAPCAGDPVVVDERGG